jgi:hypothetical protein
LNYISDIGVMKLPKIEVNVSPTDFEFLSKIAKAVGISVEQLVQQEVDGCLSNAQCWIERFEMVA